MGPVYYDETKKTDLINYLLNSPLYGAKKPDVEKTIDEATKKCVKQFNLYTNTNIDKWCYFKCAK